MARAERALDNYKLATPPNYQLEASRSGCDREGFKLLQKFTTTSFFGQLAGEEIIKYLEGSIVIGPAPQPYPIEHSGPYREELPLPPPKPMLGIVPKTPNGKYTAEAQSKIIEHYDKMQAWEIINQVYLATPSRADQTILNPKQLRQFYMSTPPNQMCNG